MLQRQRQFITQVHRFVDAGLAGLAFWLAHRVRDLGYVTEVLQRDEVSDPPEITARPGPRSRPRPTRDEEAVVGNRLEVAGEQESSLARVHADRTRTDTLKPEPLIGIALERFDVPVAHLPGKHPHQRRTGEEMVALFGNQDDLPGRLSGSDRKCRLHPGHAISEDDHPHSTNDTPTGRPRYKESARGYSFFTKLLWL